MVYWSGGKDAQWRQPSRHAPSGSRVNPGSELFSPPPRRGGREGQGGEWGGDHLQGTGEGRGGR